MHAAKSRRVEAGAVAERRAHDGVVARRHVLQHAQLIRDVEHRIAGAPDEARRRGGLVLVDESGGRVELHARQLEPELGRLMDRLEQVLVAMHHFRRRLLQRQELVGPEVALVVGRRGARQHRLVEIAISHGSAPPLRA